MCSSSHSSRSGILVLVNDVDWEVFDREKTELNVRGCRSYRR